MPDKRRVADERFERMELILKHLQRQQAELKRIVERCLDAPRRATPKKSVKKR
jgi:hypothetical protein